MFSTSENLLVEISGALGINRNPLSKLQHVLRKCCGVSQKQWMLELSNLCHCVQHPWKLTSRDYWSSRNDSKSTFTAKMCFGKNAVGYLRTWWMLELSNLCHLCSAPSENLLVEITGALGKNESHFLQQKCVLGKCCGDSQKWWVLELSNLCHCVQHPGKLTARDFWSSWNEESHFLSKIVFWENAVGYLRNSEC